MDAQGIAPVGELKGPATGDAEPDHQNAVGTPPVMDTVRKGMRTGNGKPDFSQGWNTSKAARIAS